VIPTELGSDRALVGAVERIVLKSDRLVGDRHVLAHPVVW